jgi:hypothetical protein
MVKLEAFWKRQTSCDELCHHVAVKARCLKPVILRLLAILEVKVQRDLESRDT